MRHEIEIIKKQTPIKYFRIPILKEDDDFSLPQDEYHVPINALYQDKDIYERINRFAKCDKEDALFVIAGHSYDFEMNNHWEYIEELLKYIQGFGFEIMTTMEFVDEFYYGR